MLYLYFSCLYLCKKHCRRSIKSKKNWRFIALQLQAQNLYFLYLYLQYILQKYKQTKYKYNKSMQYQIQTERKLGVLLLSKLSVWFHIADGQSNQFLLKSLTHRLIFPSWTVVFVFLVFVYLCLYLYFLCLYLYILCL